VAELEDKIARAEVIDVSKLSGKQVTFGATVTIADEDTDEKLTYQIVGQDEADIKAGRLSIGAPLARALIGKSVGDSAEVMTPSGAKSYEIVRVRFR
jgi:transcription elongation factor GreA